MDEAKLDSIRDFTKFAAKFLLVSPKGSGREGGLSPFILNRAQLFAHRRLEAQLLQTGKVRALVLKGRQQGMCWSKNMQVLTSDYRWIKIGDIKIGDSLVACDEESPGKTGLKHKQARKFRSAIVEDKREFFKEVYEILLDNGARLEVTGDHRILCKQRGGVQPKWRHVSDFELGDQIRVVARPPYYKCQSYEDGWMAGIIDGEGSHRGSSGAKRLSVHQVQGPILDRMKAYFNNIDIPYKEVIDRRTKCGQRNKLGDKPVHRLDIHRLPYLMELFARCRPTRFTDKQWHVGHELPGKSAQDGIKPWAQVISIKSLGKMEVIDLQTSTKTYICEGIVSHNSTMIQGRNFHKIITTKGNKAFVLAHESDATDNLFKITRRFYDNLPEGLCPAATKLNMSEMEFAQFNSSYKVGTAGNKKTGRSQTIQLFHGSEVGFWENTDALSTGVLQAVSDSPGTEIILESTANGIGNFFHSSWLDAMAGKSEYQAIFIPWYWQDEYAVHVEGFKLTEEEEQLLKSHEKNGLTIPHLTWRRIKISNLNKDEERANDMFKQEYPFTANEAFLNPVQESFIKSRYVARARSNEVESDSALIIGVDPAIGDNDRTAIIRRKGRLAYGLEAVRNHNTMEIAGKLKRIIEQERPFKVYIDCIGIGAGVVDRLQEMGFECVEALNVARTANQKERFANLRAELWSEMRDWLMQNELPVQIPDNDELHGDLCSLGFKHRSNGQLLLESKAELRARGMPSCDLADALMHTFACGQYLQPTSGFYVKPPAYERGMFT